jgi:hypothetical protein
MYIKNLSVFAEKKPSKSSLISLQYSSEEICWLQFLEARRLVCIFLMATISDAYSTPTVTMSKPNDIIS